MLKFIAIVVISLAVVSAQNHHSEPERGSNQEGVHKDYYTYPKYTFEYGVKDPHTGDHKSQWETRDGDAVKGGYTVHEADGSERVVEYTSDKQNGFQAHVKMIGGADHPQARGD
ncbi:cuticle protein 19-like [Toxorhynchites rutilus septentrionalis]|uniref:cuticle protein 19-like n=1 Tax=Toxorhynchites rutilus septentrionalis TaxID=329112 RepID=UPI00247B1D8A|nr:cuticle protein 19-like [Toxorhynchites rutilus septentrionalis]